MIAIFARRLTILFGCFALAGAFASAVSAGELSDSIQQFHRGDFKSSYDGLTKLIQTGQKDPRAHYYRGLIVYRFGDRNAAAQDFRTAAALEASGVDAGVGESLQRIQGQERLVLEKYRTMARLAGRRKSQPAAPPAIPRKTDSPIQLVANLAPVIGPSFRLASEVPMRQSQTEDPFRDESRILAADDRPSEPALVKSPAGSEEPVGTGVADADDLASVPDLGSADEDDIFGGLTDDTEIDDEFDSLSSDGSAGDGPKPSTVFGAVFRAITRSAVPQISPQGMVPGGIPGMQPPPDGAPGGDFPGPGIQGDQPFPEDGFSDEAFGDEGEDPF